MLAGKYLNGYGKDEEYVTYIPSGWDEGYVVIKGHYFNYTVNENGKRVRYGDNDEDYETDVLAWKVLDFINRTAGGQLFFVYFAPFAPHNPATASPRHKGLFPNATAPRTMNFNESDVSDKSAYIRNLQPLDDEQVEDIDEHYRNRLRYLQAVDEAVASIVSLLKAVNQLDRTYIFFTSDNGFYLGNLRMPCGKNTPYMENIHVPLIMRGPGIPQGKVIEGLADNVDLAPTWAELAAQRYLIWTAVRWCRC